MDLGAVYSAIEFYKETSRFDKSDSVADCGLDHHCIAGREMAPPMMRRLQPIQKLPFKNMEQAPGAGFGGMCDA